MSLPRLRIAFISYKFGHEYGGAEAYGVELMRELSQYHDITVITKEYAPQCDLQLPRILVSIPNYLPSWLQVFWFAKKAAQITNVHSYDVVHSHTNGWNADIDVLHVKSVRYHHLYRHTSWLKRVNTYLSPRLNMYLWLEKQRVHQQPPKRTVVVSEWLKKQIQAAYHTSYPFDVITPGVHIPKTHAEQRALTRKKLGFNKEDVVSILVARNPLSKGLNTLVTALETCAPTMKLLVVGPPLAFIKSYAAQLSPALQARVRFVEQTESIHPYYEAADLCVHPTLNDSFGMAPLEAMSYGLPVILSQAKYCGFAHHVRHQYQAWVLEDPTDAQALAHALQQVAQCAELRQNLAKNGQQLALTFSWPQIAQHYQQLYIEILAHRQHHKKPNPFA